jgi:hypothetical protein
MLSHAVPGEQVGELVTLADQRRPEPDLADAIVTASSGKNMQNLLHVTVSGGGCLFWTAAILTRTQIRRVPVPPVMLGVSLLVFVVVLCRLAEKVCKDCNV